MARRTKLKGIRRKGNRWEVSVRVNKKLYSTTFTLETDLKVMRDWIEDTKAAHGGKARSSAGFHVDAAKYLADVKDMPSIASRTSDITRWTEEISEDVSRHAIDTATINAILKKWDRQGLNPGTIHNRRTALQAFFTHLDPDMINPVKGSIMYKARKPEVRGRDMVLINRIIDAMRDKAPRKGSPPNLAKIRARVIATTGLPPALIKKLTTGDLLPTPAAARVVHIDGRDKGEGVEARDLELTADASAAFAAFHAANAYGPFATNAVNRSFKDAAARVVPAWRRPDGKPGVRRGTIRLYDARHSFLTDIYLTHGKLDQVGRFAMHAPGSKRTAQYAAGAFKPIDHALIVEMDARNAARRATIEAERAAAEANASTTAAVPNPGDKLDGKVGRRRKARKRNVLQNAA